MSWRHHPSLSDALLRLPGTLGRSAAQAVHCRPTMRRGRGRLDRAGSSWPILALRRGRRTECRLAASLRRSHLRLAGRREHCCYQSMNSAWRSDMARNSYTAPAQFQKKNVILIVVDSLPRRPPGAGPVTSATTRLSSIHFRQSGHLRTVRTFYSASCCTFGRCPESAAQSALVQNDPSRVCDSMTCSRKQVTASTSC